MPPTHTKVLTGCLLALLLLSTGCDPRSLLGPQADNADRYNLRVSYHRGACYGRCEVYTLDVYDNGLLIYKGERFTDRPGVWERNIDRRQITALLDSFERADFASFPRAFASQIPDAPLIEFTYKDPAGTVYRTSYKEQATATLNGLDRAMRRLAALPGYRQVSTELPERDALPTTTEQPQEIIVHLREEVNVQNWLIGYGKQNVRFKERLSPNGSYYLITADPNLMAANELLDYLRQDEAVLSAQLNKAVDGRR